MAGGIFCGCVDADIDAKIQRLEIQRCCPRVVHHDDGASLVSCVNDCRNVLYFECVRGWRFRKYHFGVGTQKLCNARADFRIVVFNLNAHTLQDRISKVTGRIVDRVDKQNMVARR
ncbi:hypothetical protein D3C81_1920720 [compost metagenome]